MGKVTKAQQASVNKYMKTNYDRINFVVKKGYKDAIRARADRAGESLNAYILQAVIDRMEREGNDTESTGGGTSQNEATSPE